MVRQAVLVSLVLFAGAASSSAEQPNLRMRLVALVPGLTDSLVGVDANDRVLHCNAQSQEIIRVVGECRDDVREIRVSPDGVYVATIDERGRCRIWSIASGETILSVKAPGVGEDCGAITFSPDSRHFACGRVGAIDIYCVGSGNRVRRIPDERTPEVYAGGEFEKLGEVFDTVRILSLDIKPWGNLLLLGSDRGVFEIDYLRCLLVGRMSGANDAASLVRYAPNGKDLIALQAPGRLDYFVDYKHAKSFAPGDPKKNKPGRHRFTTAAFTSDGSYLAVLGSDNDLRVVRLADYQVMTRIPAGNVDLSGLALASDRRYAWLGSQGNVERFRQITLPSAMWAKEADLE